MDFFIASESMSAVMINKIGKPVLIFLAMINRAPAQYPWPVTPFNSSQYITGAFCEYRDTAPSPHYHNGVDIPKADGSPVYPVYNGTISAIDPNGDNAYVRVGNVAYVHIRPNPVLSAGQAVIASQTVLGTILPGLGHVHLTDGFVGSEINALRENTGLTPFVDDWNPEITFVRFFLTGSSSEFTQKTDNRIIVSSRVDIAAKVREQSAPPGAWPSDATYNNGAYKLGYQILNAQGTAVVLSPPNNGLRFQFDRKPTQDVHNTFHPSLSSTSSHVYYATNTPIEKSYWDTEALPEGDYTVMVFAEDTRHNADTARVAVRVTRRDLLAPAQPLLLAVVQPAGLPQARWQANTESDLVGYRLEASNDIVSWSMAQDETQLGKAAQQADLLSLGSGEWYTRLTAVDGATPPNVSVQTDVYGYATSPRATRLLIVDGFDRHTGSGSYLQPWHSFAFQHGRALAENGSGFESCANDAVMNRAINLTDYDAVFWLLGDESTADETFSVAEQALARAYLQQGGNLFVSGSEVGWDLDPNAGAGGTASDEAFLHDFLKADYAQDDANNYSVNGVAGSIFEGLNFGYGNSPYVEDYPDAINEFGGSSVCLKYANGLNAAVQFSGTFSGGNATGRLVYFGFPFETITLASARTEIMRRVLDFFFPATPVAETPNSDGAPSHFVLEQNYPNPFNPSTSLRFGLPMRARVQMDIYNALGQRVRRWPGRTMEAGYHRETWDGRNDHGLPAASGEYFLRLLVEPIVSGPGQGTFTGNLRMTLIK
jgi:hypothetical protein